MKLRTRLLLTLIAIAVLLAGPAIYALSKLTELREIAGEQRTRHAKALMLQGDLNTRVAELDRYERSYIVNADDASRVAMENALREARLRLNELNELGYDEAFNKLPQDKVTDLFKPENRDYLKNLLLLHLVPGTLRVDELKKREALKTEAGREIKVEVSQDAKQIKIENASVTEPREEAENWCLYAIDAILQPTARAARA